jgi:Chitinase class I
MPGLSDSSAQKYVDPLNTTMRDFGITSLEQRAMFLAQVARESANLTTWTEKPRSPSYFIDHYWLSPSHWHYWESDFKAGQGERKTLGPSEIDPLTYNIQLRVPVATVPGDAEDSTPFELWWATGIARSAATERFATPPFVRRGDYYEYTVPAPTSGTEPPPLTTNLLVVDPNTNSVLFSLHDDLGNWSATDATMFIGRGPIQYTGRFNYQSFATYANLPGLMTDPTMMANDPDVGLQAAGYFVEGFGKHDLDGLTNDAGNHVPPATSVVFNKTITYLINPEEINNQAKPDYAKATKDRLDRYCRIRGLLLNAFAEPQA